MKIHPVVQWEVIGHPVYVVRGAKVMLSSDLALLYQVPPRVLVQAVKRKIERFPPDFMFQLTSREFTKLKSQIVTSSWGGMRKAPHAFTAHGVAMLSGVLRSGRAASVHIEIMRAFVCLRRMLASNDELAHEHASWEEKHDARSKVVFDLIREMMNTPSRSVALSVSNASASSSRTIEMPGS